MKSKRFQKTKKLTFLIIFFKQVVRIQLDVWLVLLLKLVKRCLYPQDHVNKSFCIFFNKNHDFIFDTQHCKSVQYEFLKIKLDIRFSLFLLFFSVT